MTGVRASEPTAMAEPVRVGLVGAGRIARVHADAYLNVARGSIDAVTDPVESASAQLAADYGYRVIRDFDAMLDDPAIDAVLLATPTGLHADQAIAALAAGKHVFCQKPISLTLDQADRVVAAASASDRVLQFGFMLRFTPPLPGLQGRIARGELGPIIAAQAAVFGWEPTNEWFYDPANGGGVILDTLVHFGDLVLWLFGPAEHVHTEGGAYKLDGAKRYGSPDNAVVTIRHTSGVVSSLYVTWTAGHGNFRIDVYGNDGQATVDLVKAQALEIHLVPGAGRTPGWQYPDLVWSYGYAGEQQYFVDRILGRTDGTIAATAQQARDALALMLAAQESLDRGQIVSLS